MVNDLPAHTRDRIDETRTFHHPAKRAWWEWLFRRRQWCEMCGQWWVCRDRLWAEDVAAGRRAPAGWGVTGPLGIPEQRIPKRHATWWEY